MKEDLRRVWILEIPYPDSMTNNWRARFDGEVVILFFCYRYKSQWGFLPISSSGCADLRNGCLSSGGFMRLRDGWMTTAERQTHAENGFCEFDRGAARRVAKLGGGWISKCW